MDLKQFSDELKTRTNAEIDRITGDQPDILARTSQLIVSVEKSVHELKRFVIKYKFRRVDEEVEFFKKIKPHFVSLRMAYKKLFQIQLFEAYNSSEVRLKYFRKYLKKLECFMNKNWDYYHYILSDSEHMDEKYFTRSSSRTSSAMIDDRFSTPYDIKLSKILCNVRIKDYLTNAMQKLEGTSSPSSNSSLTWTGSKTDLIELIYALQAAGVFNKKEADVKQIAMHFENVFNVTLGNYYRVFQDIRIRKTGQVSFLNRLTNILIERIRLADS